MPVGLKEFGMGRFVKVVVSFFEGERRAGE